MTTPSHRIQRNGVNCYRKQLLGASPIFPKNRALLFPAIRLLAGQTGRIIAPDVTGQRITLNDWLGMRAFRAELPPS